MVDDDVVGAALGGDGVDRRGPCVGAAGHAGADADVLHDHFVRGDIHAAADQRDARAGRCLACDVEEGLRMFNVFAPRSMTPPNFEDDDARSLRFTAARKEPGPSALRLSRDDLAAAPALCRGGPALRPRESQRPASAVSVAFGVAPPTPGSAADAKSPRKQRRRQPDNHRISSHLFTQAMF